LHDSELLHVAPPVFEKAMQDARFARAIAILQTARIRAVFGFLEDAALRCTRARRSPAVCSSWRTAMHDPTVEAGT
jgi:CRP/FNR family cyclic AMP-dependent transcriptional regulator